MQKTFDDLKTESILLVETENACNNIIRKVLLHNAEYVRPELASLICKCFIISARLFIIGGQEIRSREGTTQEIQLPWRHIQKG